MSRRGDEMGDYEPDFQQIIDDREDRRAELRARRLDGEFGITEQHLPASNPNKRCMCGVLWGGGQAEHGCRFLAEIAAERAGQL